MPYVMRTCQKCQKVFQFSATPAAIKGRRGKYCSKDCQSAALRSVDSLERVCQHCHTSFIFQRQPSRLLLGEGMYCSRTCQGAAKSVAHALRRATQPCANCQQVPEEGLYPKKPLCRACYNESERERQRLKEQRRRREQPEKAREMNLRSLRKHAAKRNARLRQVRAANRAKENAAKLAYKLRHPEANPVKNNHRRAMQQAAPIDDFSTPQWRELMSASDYRCAYCPDDCVACQERTHRLTPDHITPYIRGGSNTLWNIVPACKSCNCRKKAGPPPRPVQPLLLTLAPRKKQYKRGNKQAA